jgi:hypothetical protein
MHAARYGTDDALGDANAGNFRRAAATLPRQRHVYRYIRPARPDRGGEHDREREQVAGDQRARARGGSNRQRIAWRPAPTYTARIT